MIQQKKIHTNFSLNYFQPFQHQQTTKKVHNVQQKQHRSKRNSSVINLNDSHIEDQNLNKQYHEKVNKAQKSKNKQVISQKPQIKQKSITQIQKNKRKTSKICNQNISASVSVLTQNKENQNRLNSKQKRKSFLKFQNPNHLNVQNQQQNSKKTSKCQNKYKKFKDQVPKQKNFSLKKYKLLSKNTQIERKKHNSCASILQRNPKSKSNSKSKSKSKSKQKKTKKKHSFKFNKINLNKQNQPRNKSNFATQSIEKQFKLITKKLEKQFEMKPKKSIKSTTKNVDNDVTLQIEKKKLKASNKQNYEPTRKKSRFRISMTQLQQPISPTIVIKKQSLHGHRKFSQRIEIKNLKISAKPRSIQKSQANDIYFFIKKDDTPTSSKKEFPVNKYLQPFIPIEARQIKRHSFQKTVKQNRKKSLIHEKDQSLSKDRYQMNVDETKPDNIPKKKTKISSKSKNKGNLSCLYLTEDKQNQKFLKRRSQSLSDQQLIYRQSTEQSKQRVQFSNKTIKQSQKQSRQIKQAIIQMKKCFNSSKQEPVIGFESRKIRVVQNGENRGNSQETFIQYPSQSFNHSLNIQEIRYYESISPSHREQRRMISERNTIAEHENQIAKGLTLQPKIFEKYFKSRAILVSQLRDEYPLLNKKQLQFLASICFIQRKWKEILVARKIKDLISLKNTSQLFVRNKKDFRPFFENQDKNSSNVVTSVMISKSQMKNFTTQSQNTQTEQFMQTQQHQSQYDMIQKKQSAKKQQKQVEIKELQSDKQMKTAQKVQKQNQQQGTVPRSLFQQQDIFPDISYLKTKKYLQKRKLIEGLALINETYKQKQISEVQYDLQKRKIQLAYQQAVKQINSTKKVLKKGYLKYIETLKTVNESLIKQQKSLKSSRKNTPSKLLKRINSQESILGDIYKKIFKLDQLSSENGSQISGETKRLNESFLIRKGIIPYQIQRSLQLKKLNGLGKNLGYKDQSNFIYTERSRQNIKSEQLESNTKPMSTRQLKSLQLEQNAEEDTNHIMGQEQLSKQKKQASKQINIQQYEQGQSEIFLPKQEQQNAYNITELIQSKSLKAYNISELLLSPDQLNSLGQSPIQRISKKQQHSPEDIMQLQKVSNQQFTIKEIDILQEDKSLKSQKEQFQRQLGEDQIDNICFSLDVNLQDYNDQMPSYISPVSSTMSVSNGANIESKQYLKNFVQYLKNSQQFSQIILQGLNNPQGFSAISYLRFVRQFELPQDEYTQIIPNHIFIQYEEQNLQKSQSSESKISKKSSVKQILHQELWQHFSFNQYKGIEHRCLYELLNAQIETFRIYGEKGKPFPWEINFSCYNPPEIEKKKVNQILDKCLQKCISNVLIFSCGIILQNHPDILTEEDLQELHDKNQDLIIDMIEGQLVLQKNAWYELQQHTLQTNFEVSQIIWNEMINQFTKELIKIKVPKTFTF